MAKEDELLEGIQIMSPEELQSEIVKNQDSPEEVETSSEELEIVPVKQTRQVSNEDGKTEDSEEELKGDKKSLVYKTLIKTLADDGIITLEEQEELEKLEGSAETIKKLIGSTINKSVEEKQSAWKKGLSTDKKKFLEIEDAFTDAEQAILTAQRLEFFEKLNDTDVKSDVNLQKQLFAESLRVKGFSDVKIAEELQDAVALGKLEKKALDAYPDLLKETAATVEENRAKVQAARQSETEEQTKSFEQLMTNIDSRDAFIDGLPLNKVSKEKLKKNIVEPVYTDPKTGKEYNSLMYKQKRNPQEFEMLLNYYDTLGLFNIDKNGNFKSDISKLKAVAKTQAISDLDSVLESKSSGVGRNSSTKNSEVQEEIFSVLERGGFGK